jgi:hypothetical protein
MGNCGRMNSWLIDIEAKFWRGLYFALGNVAKQGRAGESKNIT